MKIIFSGGGSGGPTSPLLAVYEQLKKIDPSINALWVGTGTGPERGMVGETGVPFRTIASGKLRRYFSIRNVFDPLFVGIGFLQSVIILRSFKPDAVLTAGSFVAVPVAWAAALLRIPVFVHQQDIVPGLANKLMSRVATLITVTFKKSIEDFAYEKTMLIGNPVRERFASGQAAEGTRITGLPSGIPTVLIMGGGQGAAGINQLVLESVGALAKKYNVIHLTGAGKSISDQFQDYYDHATRRTIEQHYRAFPFLNQELPHVLASASLVVSRAGISTISEVAFMKKPLVLIPLPESHQEQNAAFVAKEHAALVLNENELDAASFTAIVSRTLDNPADLQQLSKNISTLIPSDAAQKYAAEVVRLIGKK